MLKILARNPLFSLFLIETNTPMNIIKFSAGGLFQTGKVFDCRYSLFLRHREKFMIFWEVVMKSYFASKVVGVTLLLIECGLLK